MSCLFRQFTLCLLTMLWATCSMAADSAEPARLQSQPVAVDKTIMVLFEQAAIDGANSGSRMTNYRNRTGYYTTGRDRRMSESVGNDYDLELVTDWPITELGVVCAVFNIPDDRTVESVITQLQVDPRLQLVQQMNNFAVQSSEEPYYGLQSKQNSLNLGELHRFATGKDVSIAIIDTGVDTGHVDLAGQFALSKNFAEDYSSGFNDDRHGTAVAGIIAAKDHNKKGMVGVAPDARLLALKACWPTTAGSMESMCNTLTLALALNKAIMEKVSIINMSLAGPEDNIIGLLLKKSLEQGILVVAADSANADDNHFPASMAGVLAATPIPASATEAEQQPSTDSLQPHAANSARIAAPGVGVMGTAPGNNYDFFSGSSFAAANVSGLAALLMQQCGTAEFSGIEAGLQALSRRLLAGETVNSLTCQHIGGHHQQDESLPGRGRKE